VAALQHLPVHEEILHAQGVWWATPCQAHLHSVNTACDETGPGEVGFALRDPVHSPVVLGMAAERGGGGKGLMACFEMPPQGTVC
jgi:hypothetical protein